jgi:type I restriction enzyme S subunit
MVVLRGIVAGSEIAAERRIRVRAGQFILSRIDARNGALGVVPDELDGAVVSNDFPTYNLVEDRLARGYLSWLSKTVQFVDLCRTASEGTTNRVRLQEDRFLAMSISLPPLSEQQRIVAKIEQLAYKIEEARGLHRRIERDSHALLVGTFRRLVGSVPYAPMVEVAPLERRPVHVRPDASYPELGIRSFGKGTFHKPALQGLDVGTKSLFRLEPGDLVFNNVFAWEGAVAVVRDQDKGRVGSHRFIARVPKPRVATAEFLRFYFLTPEGLDKLGKASPGGAGRNRTLGLAKLDDITVPVPSIQKQKWFDDLQAKVDQLQALQAQTAAELDALLPSILDKAFKGEL